jgi:hypothetical protein
MVSISSVVCPGLFFADEDGAIFAEGGERDIVLLD